MIGYYDESVFRDFIKDASKEFPQIKIVYLREYQALGTAGGLYHFRDAILKGKPERFFVLNADVCCSFPLNDMLKLFEDKDAEAVILGTRVSEDAASNFGCIVSDAHTRRVLHYVEKPESHISSTAASTSFLLNASSPPFEAQSRSGPTDLDLSPTPPPRTSNPPSSKMTMKRPRTKYCDWNRTY
jgi:NDP-sugar pyrophosphorylase family protein